MLRLAPLRFPALIIALGMIGAAPALAQVRVATLDELRREVSAGDLVSVVQTTGDAVTGRLQRFGDTGLDIRAETPPTSGQPRRLLDVTIPFSAVQSVERRRDSVRNGTLIGAGIGGGTVLVAFVWALSVDRNEIDEWGLTYLAGAGLYTGIGALAGWAIDSARSKPHIRFDASSRKSATIHVTPLLVRRAGMAVAFSF